MNYIKFIYLEDTKKSKPARAPSCGTSGTTVSPALAVPSLTAAKQMAYRLVHKITQVPSLAACLQHIIINSLQHAVVAANVYI